MSGLHGASVEYICWSVQFAKSSYLSVYEDKTLFPFPSFLCWSLTDVLLSTVACTYLLRNPMTGRTHSFEAIRHHPSPNQYASAPISCQEERAHDS